MQVAEIALYPTLDGPTSGTNVLSAFDSVSAFQLPKPDSRYPQTERPASAHDGTAVVNVSESSFPAGENPGNAIDGTNAKYLNFGREDSGFIVTPAVGSSQVRSFRLTTANDAEPRDPASWQLFGTNETIASAQNSYGLGENWTLIDSGALALPTARNTLGPVVPVNNTASYSSYKMIFPTVKDGAAANSMQMAEASFYSTLDGTGTDILSAGDPIIAIDATPGPETKYLNFGKENSGLIVTPSAGPTTVTSLQIRTANDAESRDPASYELYGTNSPVTSADNSQGTGETWTLISSGTLDLPVERQADGTLVTFANSTSYKSYKIVFPTLRDTAADDADSLQIGGIQLFDASAPADADVDNDGDVDGRDFLIWQRGNGTASGATNGQGDANGDGAVNAADLAAWRGRFGAAASAATAAVPEPATVSLGLVAASLAWAAARCRRNG
jgi:hypothetical protein